MSFNTKNMTQGGQVAIMNIRMFTQVGQLIIWALTILFISLTAIFIYISVSWQNFVNGLKYWWVKVLLPEIAQDNKDTIYRIQYYGTELIYTPYQILNDKYLIYCGDVVRKELIMSSVYSLVICTIVFFIVLWFLGRKGERQSTEEHISGRIYAGEDHKKYIDALKKDNKVSDLKISDIPLVKDSEIQNLGLIGTVGVGKSSYIRELLDEIRKRGDLVIIYDKSCDFVKQYYRDGKDIILNPRDERCADWDLWEECQELPDYDYASNTLIPMGKSEDPFWQGSARTIFSEGAYRMKDDEDRSYEKLLNVLLSLKMEKLREYLKGMPSENLVAEQIEKTAISIRGVLTNYVKALKYLQGIEKGEKKFTIREWMKGAQDHKDNSWLFITSDAASHVSLKPLISMWISIAIRNLLAMGENYNRRVWIFLDELPTLHKLPDLVEILPEARKFGGCFVLGFQSLSQLEDVYGDKSASTIFDVINTRWFFRAPSEKMAKRTAAEIGERIIEKPMDQLSFGTETVKDGYSQGKTQLTEQLLNYSVIQTLPNLTSIMTTPGEYPVIKITVKYKQRPEIAPPFILRKNNAEKQLQFDEIIHKRELESINFNALFDNPNTADVMATKPNESNSAQGSVAGNQNTKQRDLIESGLITQDGEIVDYDAYTNYEQLMQKEEKVQTEMQLIEERNTTKSKAPNNDLEIGAL
ncbi:type IV conjugative transfer system coupling protein TraD [Providencia sp. wls1919]|nr:type IV conjugative transfer system coupling protein TraD [Providencia sp. wls1919]